MIAGILSLFLFAGQLASAASPEVEGPACSLTTARRMTIEEITAEQAPFEGLCVQVSGIGSARALFGSVEARYLWARSGGGDDGPYMIVFTEPLVPRGEEPTARRTAHLTVTGRLWTCPDRFRPDPERQVENIPACNGVGGRVLLGDRVEWLVDRHRPLERLVGAEMHRRFGSIVEAPAEWPLMAAARATAADFLQALRE